MTDPLNNPDNQSGEIPQLWCISEIRQIVGDPEGGLMLGELVEKIRNDYQRLRQLEGRAHVLRGK